MSVAEKICCTCEQSVDITLFYKNKNTDDGLSAQCKKCAKEYRDTHKEEKKNYPTSTKEYKDQYTKENIEHINELRRERYRVMVEENPEKVEKLREISRIYYANHPIEMKEYRSNYWENNKDVLKDKNKKWRHENIDYILLRNRARQKTLDTNPISQEEINKLLASYDNKCFYCKIDVKRGINLHIDHAVPLSRGGLHSIDNLVPACAPCNLKKGTKTSEEYIKYMKIVKESNVY